MYAIRSYYVHCPQDHSFFYCGKGFGKADAIRDAVKLKRSGFGIADLGRQVRNRDHAARGQDDGPFNDIFQFPDIAFPLVVTQPLDCFFVNTCDNPSYNFV